MHTLRIFGAALICGLAFATASAADNADDVNRMEQAVSSQFASGAFMGSVLVARGNVTLLAKGYGDADIQRHVPNSPTTKFRLGSVTKQFTAAAILLLQERGKLRVEDPVKKYLPEAPAAWDQITIFNLLTHTSGIPNFTSFPDYRETESKPTTPAELVARFRDKPLDFPPGRQFRYSNSGYALLGYLIEKVSGQTYQRFLQDHIFKTLRMQDSGYDSNTQVIENRATGYSPGPDGRPTPAGYIDMTIPYAAGGLYSTVEDLLRWERALYGGKLLSAASLKQMTTPFKDNYAFGLFVAAESDGTQVMGHGGGIEGFNTALAYVPSQQLAIVVLANLNGATPEDLSNELKRIALHLPAKPPAPGGEAALRQRIAELAAGKPDYSHYGEQLGNVTRQQLPKLQEIYSELGAVQKVEFQYASGDIDVYRVTYEHGKGLHRFHLAPDGKMTWAAFQRLPAS